MRHPRVLLQCLLALGVLWTAAATVSVDLGALEWRMTNGNGSVSLNTTVPAHAVEVLRREGVIFDPMYRYGERESRWVALDYWTFATNFSSSSLKDLKGFRDVVLSFDGIDTFANITLNGKLLATVDSYYRTWAFPVKDLLVAGDNTLAVTITPAIPTAIQRKAEHPYYIPTVTQLGNVDAYNFMRKPAYDFGWDWGPGFGASGIHGAVQLIGYDTAALKGVHLHQHYSAGVFDLMVEAELWSPPGGDSGVLTVALPALGVVVEMEQQATAGQSFHTANIPVQQGDVELWWPIGMGKQPLYDVVVTWTPDVVVKAASSITKGRKAAQTPAGSNSSVSVAACSTQGAGNTCSSITRRVGFRQVRLVQKPLPEAAEALLGAASGWNNSVVAKAPVGWCKGNGRCGQWGWINATRWSFISAPNWNPGANKDAKHSKYEFGVYPGGEQPWWADDALGVYIGTNGNPADADLVEGESFYFEVNGVPLYSKGANIIPMHVLSTNVTDKDVKKVLDMAIASKMNMLRVWGGGWYNNKFFYDYADETGLLVWQETMFACAPYPRHDEFIANVKVEVEQQVRRINGHPSVVIWGGNNEVETSFDWYRTTDSNRALFAADFMALFIDVIGKAINELAPGAVYLDSSPTNGLISHQPYIKRWGNAQDPRYGDVHFYDYYSDCQKVETFPQSKFVSEHGWPSFPTWATWQEATGPEDWGVGVPGMEFRQRHFNKTMEMINQYGYHFSVPDWLSQVPKQNTTERTAGWKQYLYFNHVQQALCMGTASSYWRRLRSCPKALTMGLLYWQLNDVWAGASWSGMDYGMRWKPMQYAINRQFKDFVVQAHNDNGTASVYVVSDLMQPTKAELVVSIHSLYNNTCSTNTSAAMWSHSVNVTVPALNAALVWAMPVASLLAKAPGCSVMTCYVDVKARAAAPADAQPGQAGYKEDLSSHATLFLAQYKQLALVAPEVSLGDFKQVDNQTVAFTMSSAAAAAPLTVLDTPAVGHFSDNMLDLAPCDKVILSFRSTDGPIDAKEFASGLSVQTLYSNQASGVVSISR